MATETPIARLRALAEEAEATPRPWIVSRRELYTLVQTGLGGQPYSFANVAGGLRAIDAELLVAAVNALPDLIAAVEAAKTMVDGWNSQGSQQSRDANKATFLAALDKLYRPAGGEEAVTMREWLARSEAHGDG